MKRISFYILCLLVFVNCDQNTGELNDGKWQSIDCDPPLDWLEDYIAKPYAVNQPQQMPAMVPPAPGNDYGYYNAYQYSQFLCISVTAEDCIRFMHHTAYPCSYSVRGWVESKDNKLVVREKLRKPVGLIPPCICNATIASSIKVSHLNYDTIQLGETKYLVNLYEGLDTLIMFHTDVPDEPITNFSVSGLVTDQYGKAIKSAQIILQNTTQLLLDTVYTNTNGYYHGFYELDSPINLGDTLSVIALEPFYNFYDTTKLAFADMDYYSSAWSIDYSAEVNIQLKKK